MILNMTLPQNSHSTKFGNTQSVQNLEYYNQSCPRVGWTRGSGRVTILPDFH